MAIAPYIYAGVDEAGYGPMLGPLCVAMSVFRVEPRASEEPAADPRAASKAPDLWKLLRGAVCKEPRGVRAGRIAVNDSKRLKLANDWASTPWQPSADGSRHPLMHLERGVLAFLTAAAPSDDASGESPLPASDAALLDRLGARLEEHPWYSGEPLRLPITTSAESLALCINALRGALGGAKVSALGLRARLVGEREFNGGCERLGSKGAVDFGAAASLLREVWERWAVPGAPGETAPGGPRVVFDRHGGRTSYAALLAQAVPGSQVETLEENERCSRYLLRDSAKQARELTAQFRPRAESAHLPVALASMTAKYVRELAMARFNRHFCSRAPSLAPTAGYVGDARRWLRDAAPVLSADERRVMVRRQ